MPFAVEVLEEERLVRARWYGTSDPGETRAAVAVIKNQIGAHPIEGVLLDFRQVRHTLTPDQAFEVESAFVKVLGRRRLAFVVTSPADERVLRWIAHRAEPKGVDIDVFRDEHAAIEWLHSPDVE